MQRALLLALVAGFVFVLPTGASLAAGALLLGNSSIAGSPDNDAAGTAEAFRFTATSAGSAQSVSIYIDSGSSAGGLVAGVYRDNGGHPGTLLASGSTSPPTPGQWNVLTLDSTAQVSSGTTYWLAVLGTGGQLNFRDSNPGTGNCSENSAADDLTSLPSSWSSGQSWSTCSPSAYVTGVASSGGGSGGGGGLPTGLTLQQIDGGPNYYCSHGFTNACSSSFNGMSWDDPRFFPIGQDYSFYPNNSTVTFKDLGLNFTHRVTADTNLSALRAAGIWAIPAPGEGSNPGAETVGWHVEEPNGWPDIQSEASSIGSSQQTGRFLQISFTWNQLFYGTEDGTPCGDQTMRYVMSCPISTAGNAHLNIAGDDVYWFAASGQPATQNEGGLIYGKDSSGTADQLARGSNYGDMVDTMRGWTGTYPAPIWSPYIETDDGLVGPPARRITPPELNWADWSSIVHGARAIIYFGATTNYGDNNTFGFSQSIQSGQSISMYNQAKATHTLIRDSAPVINSPFAFHYASVTPAGYTFPTAHLAWDNGIDISTHYYTGGGYSNASGTYGNGFYLFSSVRGSESQTNIHATFTTADGYSGPVTVVGEGRTVTATNGVFTDTFAKATDAHIYQIPG